MSSKVQNIETAPQQPVACDHITGDFRLIEVPKISAEVDLQNVPALNTNVSIEKIPNLVVENQSVVDAINHLSKLLENTSSKMGTDQDLIQALENLNTTLGATPSGSLKEVIIGALFSVIAAFIFNLVYWYVVDKKKKLTTAIAKFATILDSFEKTSTEYWTYGYHRRHSKKNTIQEMRMKAEHTILRKSMLSILEHLRNEKVKTETGKQLKELLSDIYDTATGGDFESSERTEDLRRVGELIKKCTHIRMVLAGLDS